VNSYKGRPTTNYGPADFGDWGTESTAERIATGNTYKGQPTYNCRTVVGESYRGIDKTISGLRTAAGSSGTVTMSCMVRNNNPSAYNMYAYIGHDFGSTRAIAANSDWQKVQWTVNQSSMNNDYVEFRPYTNNASIYLEMTMPMVEVNIGNASQFVNGTRSVSGSLLDLTGNSSITAASNEGYDSNAQIVYDGTDDRIITQNPQFFNNNSGDTSFSNGASYEFVVKAYGTGYFAGVGSAWRISAGSTSFIFWDRDISAGTSVTTTGIGNLSVTNNYVHVAGVLDPINNEKRFYINGEEELNISYDRTPSMGTTQLALGKSYPNSNDYCNCELPVGKVYTKALTAGEVKNNYSHYKNRFGI